MESFEGSQAVIIPPQEPSGRMVSKLVTWRGRNCWKTGLLWEGRTFLSLRMSFFGCGGMVQGEGIGIG